MLATELADYLVSKGMPFREAHASQAGWCVPHWIKAVNLRSFRSRSCVNFPHELKRACSLG